MTLNRKRTECENVFDLIKIIFPIATLVLHNHYEIVFLIFFYSSTTNNNFYRGNNFRRTYIKHKHKTFYVCVKWEVIRHELTPKLIGFNESNCDKLTENPSSSCI